MELSRRFRFFAIGAVALIVGAGAWALRRGDGAPAAEHAVPLLGRGRVIVEVLNGSGKRGLARTAARVLREAGFDVVYFGTSADSARVTRVLARRGDSAAAAGVARALGAGAARVKKDTLLRVDVTVILGSDYRPPPGLWP